MRDDLNDLKRRAGILTEMPSVASDIGDRVRDAHAGNKTQMEVEIFMNYKPEVLIFNQNGMLLWSESLEQFVALNTMNELIYNMNYSIVETPMGDLLEQGMVWRRQDSDSFVPGIVQYVVFNIVLKKFPGIITDFTQSVEGRDMWLRFLSRANTERFPIGLLVHEKKNTVVMYNRDRESLSDWLHRVKPWSPVDNDDQTYLDRYVFILRKS